MSDESRKRSKTTVEVLTARSEDAEVRRLQADGYEWLTAWEHTGRAEPADTGTVLGASDLAWPGALDATYLTTVCETIADEIGSDFPRHTTEPRLLSGALHRLGWSFLNGTDPGASANAETSKGSESTHRPSTFFRAAPDMADHPFGTLTLRCSGLLYSKRNHYPPAWLSFAEMRDRADHLERHVTNVDGGVSGPAVTRRWDEVHEQRDLAETGTAARVVEHRLGTWIADAGLETDPRRTRLAYHEAFDVLERGVHTGTAADETMRVLGGPQGATLSQARAIDSIAILSWYRRPGVMTARCHLILLPLCRIVQRYRTKHPHTGSWAADIDQHSVDFVTFYGKAAERRETRLTESDDGVIVGFDPEHVRELVQLKLHALVVAPGLDLPVVENDDGAAGVPDVLRRHCDDRDELTHCLRDMRANANLLFSVSAPDYLAHMQALSGRNDTIDWILDPAHDDLRRSSVRALFVEHRNAIRSAAHAALERSGDV
jgi:hypothetical protein